MFYYLTVQRILRSIKSNGLTGILSLSLASLFITLPAYSANYRALCDDESQKEFDKANPRAGRNRDPRDKSSKKRCRMIISVTAEEISTPSKAIPTTRVTSWMGGGSSSTNVGLGAATTILLGPVGLLGFFAKNHSYAFTINGYNKEGNKETISFRFKDPSQPRRLMTELPILTGLGLGQSRSEAEITELESDEGMLEPQSIERYEGQVLYEEEGEMLYEGQDEKTFDKAQCAVSIRVYNCSYNEYLEANPSIKIWAEANPDLANKERIRLQSID